MADRDNEKRWFDKKLNDMWPVRSLTLIGFLGGLAVAIIAINMKSPWLFSIVTIIGLTCHFKIDRDSYKLVFKYAILMIFGLAVLRLNQGGITYTVCITDVHAPTMYQIQNSTLPPNYPIVHSYVRCFTWNTTP